MAGAQGWPALGPRLRTWTRRVETCRLIVMVCLTLRIQHYHEWTHPKKVRHFAPNHLKWVSGRSRADQAVQLEKAGFEHQTWLRYANFSLARCATLRSSCNLKGQCPARQPQNITKLSQAETTLTLWRPVTGNRRVIGTKSQKSASLENERASTFLEVVRKGEGLPPG